MIVVNFKTYKEATGKNAVHLAGLIKKVAKETGERIIACPQLVDLEKVAGFCETFAQHIDTIDYGSNTGWVLPEAVKEAGAEGTLINHSEHRLDMKGIKARIKKAREIGLKTIVCVKDVKEIKKVKGFNPDYIAVEPPELIGSGKSVSTEQPELIEKSVEAAHPVKLLCGAGITCADDVSKALDLGAKGVLIASGIVKADKPDLVLKEMS